MSRTADWATRVAMLLAASLSAIGGPIVGYYTPYGGGSWASAIAANGYTPVAISNFSTFDFSSLDILAVNNPSNSGIAPEISGRTTDLTAWVMGGGILILHDRWVVSTSWIPGAGGMVLTRDFTYGRDLDVVTAGTLVTNGPFGTIDNNTLDWGNYSNHGWASNLPPGSITFLSAGPDAWRAAAIIYPLGSGYVYYSSIPLDYYQWWGSVAFASVYAPNVLAYAGELAGVEPIPEPTTCVLTGLGLAALVLWRRRC